MPWEGFDAYEHRLGCHRYSSTSTSLKKEEVKGKRGFTSRRKANSVCGRNGRKHEVFYLGGGIISGHWLLGGKVLGEYFILNIFRDDRTLRDVRGKHLI